MKLNQQQMQTVGLDGARLCNFSQESRLFRVHRDAIEPFLRLQHDAQIAGFDMGIVSAYRDFNRQLSIWNAKAQGKRAILDSDGNILDFFTLDDRQKLYAILRWSALPGTSRHHWGTDLDVYDANQIAFDEVKLTRQEVETGGPCAAMHEWLSEKIANNESYGFFRPYSIDSGGIAPEMWHLSYLPASKQYSQQLTPEMMLDLWQESGLLLLDELAANINDVWNRFVAIQYNSQPDWVVSGLLLT